ncbi:2og-fe oxygenase [Moniliophthora roreri]|nr:2og-fe oxygenase [Moniliophthora roreri]
MGHDIMSTIAIGAYSAVRQSIDPVLSGFVVYLQYELSCLSEANMIPRLPELSVGNKQLHHVFQSWRQNLDSRKDITANGVIDVDEEEVHDLLICLLDRDYSKSNLKASSLEGSDRLMLTQIAPLARAYGFTLHLADVVYIESGCVMLERYGRGYRSGCYWDSDEDDEDDIDPDELDMDGVDDKIFRICNAVALDGMPMTISVPYLHGCDAHERLCVNGELTDRDYTSKFDRDDRESGTLTYTWSSKVLLITPKASRVQFTIGAVSEFACASLTKSFSEAPSARELKLVEALLEWLKSNTSDISGLRRSCTCLRDSADRWNDVQLFLRMLEACGPKRVLSLVGVDGLCTAYQAFDWAQIQEKYAEAFMGECSNDLRGQFVEKMLTAATNARDDTVIGWCNSQREAILDTLQKLEIKEIDWVVSSLQSKKNPTQYLRDTFLPRLRTIQPSDLVVWTALLTRLQEVSEGPSCTFDKDELFRILQNCVRLIAAASDAFPTKKETYSGFHTYHNEVFTIDPITDVLQLCIRYDTLDAIGQIFKRMWEGRAEQDETHPRRPAKQYYTSLVDRLPPVIEGKPQSVKACFTMFFSKAFQMLVPEYSSHPVSTQKALQNMEDPIGSLKQWLTAECLKKMDRHSVESLAKWALTTFRSRATTSESEVQLLEVLDSCSRRAIEAFDVAKLCIPSYSRGFYSSTRCTGIDLLDFCLTIRMSRRVPSALAKFLMSPKGIDANYIKDGLVPILMQLPQLLVKHQLSLKQTPYSVFAAEVTKSFTRHVLGQKPSQAIPVNELRAAGCGCHNCNRYLIPFLIGDKTSLSVREKQSIRTHIEQQVRRKASVWGGFTFNTMRSGSPHTLWITKPQRLVAMGQWPIHQAEAQKILQVLGTAQDQQVILGADYAWVTGVIAGTAALPPPAPKRQLESDLASDPKKARLG